MAPWLRGCCISRLPDRPAACLNPALGYATVSNPYSAPRHSPAGLDRCDCCKRPWSVCVERDQRWQPPKDQHTCKTCWDHADATGFKRDEDHIELWRTLINERVRELGREIGQLKSQVAAAQQELYERPAKEVIKYLGQDEIRAAQEEGQRAFASRQRAWQALSEIQCLHRERNNGICQCGSRFKECDEAQIVNSYPAFIDWVKDQAERMNRGLSCDLPQKHPARFDPRWRP
jgi:hypothetical protein